MVSMTFEMTGKRDM